MPQPKHAFLYMVDFFPQKDGNGRDVRAYSNARAYLDLGYQTSVIHIQGGPRYREYEADMAGLRLVTLDGRGQKPSRFQHAAYVAGFPYKAACGFYYKAHATLRQAVRDLAAKWPGALHHLETLSAAHVASSVGTLNTVWSCEEVPSDFLEHEIRIDAEVEHRAIHGWEARKLAFVRKAEGVAAKTCSLVLCVTPPDALAIRGRWGGARAEYLPMSVPDEAPAERTRPWLGDGTFEVLHLGQIHHLPTFRSLVFLFEEVLPRLSVETMSRLRLNIVGPIRGDKRCARLQEMGARFPQVKFFGRVPDLRTIYARNDVQIVASTEATGLRTRIIESFAYGLPVLSSSVAARGIEGLVDGENIVLADGAERFAAQLERFGREAGLSERLTRNARGLYESRYGRKVVARELEGLLERYFGSGRTHS